VLGGSRGAAWLNEHLPEALAMLPLERRPQVLHQCGRGGLEATRAAYARAGVTADIREFVDDTLAAMLAADLFIGRSGASTVSELAAVGLGSLLVPYPHHADQQQLWNARVLEQAGAARVLDQQHTDSAALAAAIDALDRAACRDMATRARRCAVPDATERICLTITEVVAAMAETRGRTR
jgi:UDP-N-acetylglucosamine--N-acetylmuramyl-(pentapeptide) pyrophosphoryl-undecaprenol N-acetylglucosamine transferase